MHRSDLRVLPLFCTCAFILHSSVLCILDRLSLPFGLSHAHDTLHASSRVFATDLLRCTFARALLSILVCERLVFFRARAFSTLDPVHVALVCLVTTARRSFAHARALPHALPLRLVLPLDYWSISHVHVPHIRADPLRLPAHCVRRTHRCTRSGFHGFIVVCVITRLRIFCRALRCLITYVALPFCLNIVSCLVAGHRLTRFVRSLRRSGPLPPSWISFSVFLATVFSLVLRSAFCVFVRLVAFRFRRFAFALAQPPRGSRFIFHGASCVCVADRLLRFYIHFLCPSAFTLFTRFTPRLDLQLFPAYTAALRCAPRVTSVYLLFALDLTPRTGMDLVHTRAYLTCRTFSFLYTLRTFVSGNGDVRYIHLDGGILRYHTGGFRLSIGHAHFLPRISSRTFRHVLRFSLRCAFWIVCSQSFTVTRFSFDRYIPRFVAILSHRSDALTFYSHCTLVSLSLHAFRCRFTHLTFRLRYATLSHV